MKETNKFSVLLIGFSPYEERLFKSIATLSKSRARSYEIAAGASAPVHIIVINGDDPSALQVFEKRFGDADNGRAVIVSASPPQRSDVVHVRRPLIVTRVLAALDQIAIESLQSVPDLVINEDTDVSRELNVAVQHIHKAPEEDSGPRALVVDDSQSVRKLMAIELRISGISGDFAESAAEAWKLLEQREYDIVFLDVVLPDVDGYAICKSLKRSRTTKHVPVVMLTGRSSPFDRVRGKLAGCNSYLVKPVPHDELQKVFRRFLPREEKRENERTQRSAARYVIEAQYA